MKRELPDRPDLATTAEDVDALNARFYGRFPFPWRPAAFRQVTDPEFEPAMLSQDVGSWNERVMPAEAEIWVAGCGTNQAVATALRFPRARVLGMDLSEQSLAIADASARGLGLTNLELRQGSLNDVAFEERFDLVICTGVIHHNAGPQEVLARLARALRRDGLLELMVYNRYHRVATTAFQRAVRLLLSETDGAVDFDVEIDAARRIVHGGLATRGLMSTFLLDYKEGAEAMIADSLIQPVEWSYTVASLEAMTSACGLAFAAPCLNVFDVARNTWCWETEFGDRGLQERYEALPDTVRWEISNELMLELSPKLWFYLQRRDALRPLRTARDACDSFLATCFHRTAVTQRFWRALPTGRYVPSNAVSYPPAVSDPVSARVLAAIDPARPIGELLRALGLLSSFSALNTLRQRLTTSAFPYLIAAG